MDDWRGRKRRYRDLMRKKLTNFMTWRGRFLPYSPEDLATVQGWPEEYLGDVPTGGTTENSQHILTFQTPRRWHEAAGEVTYLPSGIAWQKRQLVRRFCIRKPSIGEIMAKPPEDRCKASNGALFLKG